MAAQALVELAQEAKADFCAHAQDAAQLDVDQRELFWVKARTAYAVAASFMKGHARSEGSRSLLSE